MKFNQPVGKVKVNTKKGQCPKVNELNKNNCILFDSECFKADSEKTFYYGIRDEDSVKLNTFKKKI